MAVSLSHDILALKNAISNALATVDVFGTDFDVRKIEFNVQLVVAAFQRQI